MTRPRTESGGFVANAHKRLGHAARLELVAVQAIAEHGRLAFLESYRRLSLARRAIDNAVDGDAPPPAVFREDKADPTNDALKTAWFRAVAAVKAEHARFDGVSDD